MVSAKVLGDDGSGDNRAVAAGVEFCIDEKCHVISMSLGGGYDAAIHRAVSRAVSLGIFVIVAAGNDGHVPGRNTVGYPARLEETIAIGSYDKQLQLSRFSSRGEEVDFCFPGEEILSNWLDDKYRRLSGTSMATPFAAALVACWLSFANAQRQVGNIVDEIHNNNDLRQRWIECSVDHGPPGKDPGWGHGIVDANKFLQSQTVPTTPAPSPGLIEPGLQDMRVVDLLAFFGLPNTLKLSGPLVVDGQKGFFLYVPRG
jgi:minor extracellular protease Epr